jgi:hypothetical protein
MNPYLQSTLFNEGLNQLASSALWEMNTVTGEQFPALAAKLPEPLNSDFTDFGATAENKGRAKRQGEAGFEVAK